MHHFTSKAWMVSTRIPERHGQYGATTSVVGVFNTEKRAQEARKRFIVDYSRKTGEKSDYLEKWINIVAIKVCEIDEKILSEVYE